MTRNIVVDHADGTQAEFGLGLFFGPVKDPRRYDAEKRRAYVKVRAERVPGLSADFFNPPKPHRYRACAACEKVEVILGPNQVKLMDAWTAEGPAGPMFEAICLICMFTIGGGVEIGDSVQARSVRIDFGDLQHVKAGR